MTNFINTVRAILIKDLLTELKTRQTIFSIALLGLVIVWIFRITTFNAILAGPAAASAGLLISILFAAIVAAEKSFDVEYKNDCLSALLLACTDAGDIYIAKLLANVTMLSLFEIVLIPATFILFNVDLADKWFLFITIIFLINIGISSVATLLACAVQPSRAKGATLSIILMAILAPMMIPAVSAMLFTFGYSTDINLPLAADIHKSIGFLTAFAAIFATTGWLLFALIAEE